MGERPWDPISIGDLAGRCEAVGADTACDDVAAMFLRDPAMMSVVVRIGDGVRLMNRASFFQALAGPKGYGWALHRARAISRLPESAWSDLAFHADVPAVDAALSVLASSIASTDDVLVWFKDGQVGRLAVSNLFATLSKHHREQVELLEGSERRFRALIGHLSDGIVILDPSGRIVYCGATGLTASGADPAPGVGRCLGDVVYPNDLPRFWSLLRRASDLPEVALSEEVRMGDPPRTFELVARNLIGDEVVGGIVVNYRDVSGQRDLENRLRHQALHDALTGLPNRLLLLDRMGRAMERLRRSGRSVALMYIDLDGFKGINDTLGHTAGDLLLEEVGARLAGSIRPQDTLARLGGDEFAVLMDEVGDVKDAGPAAARLHATLADPIAVGDRAVRVEASIGVAVVNDACVGADEMLRRAEMAMYAAKAQGKNRTVVWSALLQTALYEDDELSADLASAIDRGELFLVYQPIVDMVSRRVRGVEALARWRHPERGLVAPDRFIPLAERTGQVVRIGEWVLETACTEVAAWHAAGTCLDLSINVSGAELSSAEFPARAARCLAKSGLPAASLEIEVTETSLISSLAGARRTIEELKRLGVRVAIDDFGTGYSSLSYLRELPVDTVKIDKSFIDQLGRSDGDSELIGGVIHLAHSIGLTVTAEGIEQEDQAARLQAMGCDLAQGYFFARPLEAAQVTAVEVSTVPGRRPVSQSA